MVKRRVNIAEDGQLLDVSPDRFNKIITNTSDISILIDRSGLIIGLYLNKNLEVKPSVDRWVSKNIRDVLTIESIEKVEKLLGNITYEQSKAFLPIELNHLDENKMEFPVAYRVNLLENNQILLAGRDLRPIAEIQQQLINAQLSIEREYEKYRGYDTRLRVILENTAESFIFIDSNTGQIVDGNQSAARLIGLDLTSLINSDFNSLFKNNVKEDFLNTLRNRNSTEESVKAEYILKKKNIALKITPAVFRANTDILILCKLEEKISKVSNSREIMTALESFYCKNPDGIVFTDKFGSIAYANETFLSICGITEASDVYAKALNDVLVRGTVDLKILVENTIANGSMQLYTTKLQTHFGRHIQVEISSTFLGKDSHPALGFVFKDISHLDSDRNHTDTVSDKALQNVMKLVGSAPLKELVADTSDVVERLCIETAIELTGNNRVAAADMLGVSRQSLYVKLRKYGLMSKDGDAYQ